MAFYTLNAKLNPICPLLALLEAHHILHVSRVRVNGRDPVRIKIVIDNPLNAELNPICHLLALLEAHHILHVSRVRVNGRDPVRTKIVIDNKIIEQVNLFNYLGNMISYEGELDIDNKLNNFLKITGILDDKKP